MIYLLCFENYQKKYFKKFIIFRTKLLRKDIDNIKKKF